MADPAAPPVTLDSIRQQYPQYKSVDDETLARGLHEKFYSQLPFNDFAAKIGYKTQTGVTAEVAPEETKGNLGASVRAAGNDVLGAAQLVGAGVANIPHTVAHGVQDIYRRATGGDPNAPDNGLVDALHITPGAQGQRMAGEIGDTASSAARTVFDRGAPTNPTLEQLAEASHFGLHGPNKVAVPIIKDVADIGGGLAAGKAVIGAAGDAANGARSALDTGVNAVNRPTATQAATLKSTPQIGRMRADGFKIAGGDSYAASNAENPGEKVDLHGPTSSAPDTLHTIQRDNQALSTQKMAEDVKLPNTRAVNPDEVQARLDKEGQVYDKLGQAIGKGRTPTVNLDHDLSTAAPSAADPAASAANTKLVDNYRDHFKASGLDGPDAVQMVKDLRNEAHVGMAGNDVNAQSLGRTKLGLANAIENEMVRQLPATAQDLKTAFPEARMQYAKLKELQSVTEGGQVSPLKVLQLKRSGAPLSGAADAVANAADVAPESMKRAAGTPDILPYAPTHTGVIRDVVNVGKRAIHKLPGNDPSTEAYQTAHYGPAGGSSATPPASSTPKISQIPPPVDLKPPPGSARSGVQTQMPLPPGPAAPPPFELTPPEGTALEPAQRPLVRANTAGRVMDPAEWDRQALARVRAMTPPERAAAEGPPVPHTPLSETAKARENFRLKGRPSGRQ